MLTEIKKVKQLDGEPKRRWFASEQMDLFIWVSESGDILNYQLTYDKPYAEKALLWVANTGFSHACVDDGSETGKYPKTPLLNSTENFDIAHIMNLFKQHAAALDPEIKQFITQTADCIKHSS